MKNSISYILIGLFLFLFSCTKEEFKEENTGVWEANFIINKGYYSICEPNIISDIKDDNSAFNETGTIIFSDSSYINEGLESLGDTEANKWSFNNNQLKLYLDQTNFYYLFDVVSSDINSITYKVVIFSSDSAVCDIYYTDGYLYLTK